MEVLLHICCAPCAIEVIRELKDTGFDKITGLSYNPNIHPLDEFKRREDCLKGYIPQEHPEIKVYYIDYNPRDYFNSIAGEIEAPQRCFSCWKLRLERTARFARENNISAFTSTLLVSPYQSQEKLKEIGVDAALKYGVEFIYRNFRKFYSQGNKKSKELGLYRQNYCGCLFSELERYEKVKSKKYKVENMQFKKN